MAASTRSKASKTRSGLTREPVPSTKSWKRQLSNPEEAKQPMKKGKNEHGDSDSDNDNHKDDDDDDDDYEGKRSGPKGRRRLQSASPPPPLILIK